MERFEYFFTPDSVVKQKDYPQGPRDWRRAVHSFFELAVSGLITSVSQPI